MAKRFKINETVRVVATGEIGVVKGRDILPIEGSNHVKIEYIVKLGEGFDNWHTFTKKALESVRKEEVEPRVYTKVYDVVDGYKLTMYAKVENSHDTWYPDERELRIGYSIYSPSDVYDEDLGIRIARKRAKTRPFCRAFSPFMGEFNAETTLAIMDVKANYIKNNLDHFINKAKKD